MNLDPTNVTYTQIRDTVHDSSILEGLGKLGITLPTSFRAGKGHIQLDDVTATGGQNLPIIDDESGQPLAFAEGDQFLALRVGVEGSPTVTALSVDVGLGATSASAISEQLATAPAAATLGASLAPAVRGGVVGASNKHLVSRVYVSALGAGKVDVSFLTL